MELFILVFEIIGTVAFSVSGAISALRKRMDLFGVCMMAIITACGGGAMRDLFLGQLPPVMFRDPVYAATAVCAAAVTFVIAEREPDAIRRNEDTYEAILFAADSVGLGIFSAVGVCAAMHAGYAQNPFFVVFLGSITGVGGGIIRDVMTGNAPYIFVKHIYACASITGSVMCVELWDLRGEALSVISCCILVIIIRVLASHYQWSLPRAGEQLSDNESVKTGYL